LVRERGLKRGPKNPPFREVDAFIRCDRNCLGDAWMLVVAVAHVTGQEGTTSDEGVVSSPEQLAAGEVIQVNCHSA
jgi:hypothetical protein